MIIQFVVPTYNRIETVRRTVKVNYEICSKYDQVELLILDNDSSDCTSAKLIEEFPGLNVVKNDKNIGLTGSFKKIVENYCDELRLIIILCDEDIIYEAGLVSLREFLAGGGGFSDSILVFNYINLLGKDMKCRRYAKQDLSWSDIEPFSFGLISGFGFVLSKEIVRNIEWGRHIDGRNNYPHFSPFTQNGIKMHVVGKPIAAAFSPVDKTELYAEWRSGGHHFSSSSVSDYFEYHCENFKSADAKVYRGNYQLAGLLFRLSRRPLKAVDVLSMVVRIPFMILNRYRFLLYYIFRRFL